MLKKQNSSKMILSLQAIRAIACIMVFISHAGFGGSWGFGAWGVSVFFVLSGFISVYVHWDKVSDDRTKITIRDAFSFSKNRIKRLFPLHVIMLIIGLLREFFTTKEVFNKYIIKLAVTIPLLQTWFPNLYRALNSVDWFLSTIFFSYFCFPYLLKRIKRIEEKKRTIKYIVNTYLIQLVGEWLIVTLVPNIDTKWIIYSFPIFRLGDFIIGCLIGALFLIDDIDCTTDTKKTTLIEIFLFIIIVLSFIIYKITPNSYMWFSYVSLFLPSSACLVFCFAKENGKLSRILVNRWTMLIAGISSYFFLIHRQVLYFMEYFIIMICGHNIKILTAIISFAITILASLFYRYLYRKLINNV